jgi:TonB family protein
VKPQYPQHLSDAGIGGQTTLEARIGSDGSIVGVTVVDATDPAFGDAAATAVRQWQFTPTQLGGVPVETRMKVAVSFVIR